MTVQQLRRILDRMDKDLQVKVVKGTYTYGQHYQDILVVADSRNCIIRIDD